jgi:predicted nuclease with RNAse H fold
VDISERRGQTVALLDGDSRALRVETVAGPEDVLSLVRAAGAAAVAVDSPLQPSRLLLRDPAVRARHNIPDRPGMRGPVYANYRVCDAELIRRGLPLYQVPDAVERAPGWMRVGFALARLLEAAGYRQPAHAGDTDASLLEVFPDAAFVTLLGGRPPRKSGAAGAAGRAWRARALAEHGGITLDARSHDALDAAVAALTALRWRQGLGCALGEPEEGMIVLPTTRAGLRDRYRGLGNGE